MATSDASEALTLAEAFASLTELQREHVALMRAGRTASEQSHQLERIRRFLDRAQATGSRLDTLAERDVAQSILDYWIATLVDLPDTTGAPPSLIVLAAFDPLQADDLADQKSPFKGLNAFGESDASWFFGREEVVKSLLNEVAQSRLVMVAGPSGSGKSSLVLAGLVPRLKAGLVSGSERWHYLPAVIPGSDPLASLLLVTCPSGSHLSAWIAEHKPRLQRAPAYFKELVDATLTPARTVAEIQPAALVVDQFEELFTLCTDQQVRTSFVTALFSIVHGQGPQHRVILTIREDFVQRAIQLKGLQDPKILFRPPPLTTGELRRVIEEPAKKIGLKFEEGIVDELVKEVVGDPTTLPLLQFTLKQLWDHRERNRITWNAYRTVGRPSEALKRTAEKLFNDLKTFENQKTAERIFLELVHPSVGAEFVRRRVRREALTRLEAADRVDRVLERLVDAGLVVMVRGSDAGDDRFEVAHETLIRNWPRFAEWLRQRKRHSERELQLIATARLWQESGCKSGYLLSGEALQEATQYRAAAPALKELILASEKASHRHARRVNRLTSLAAIVFSGLFLVSAWLAYVADEQREVAMERAEAAQSSLNLAVKAITVVISQIAAQISTDPYSSAASDLLRTAEVLLAEAETMSRSIGETVEGTEARANLLINVIDIYVAKQDKKAALKLSEQAHSLAERLVKTDSSDRRWQLLLYQSKFRIGDAVEGSEPERAMREYLLARQIAEQLAKSGNGQRRQDVAFIEPKIGDLFYARGDRQKALDQYQAALAIYQELAAGSPKNLDWERDVATTRVKIGRAFARQGKPIEARKEYEAALSILEPLVKKTPNNNTYRSNLSSVYNVLAELYLRSDELDEALELYERALKLRLNLMWESAAWQDPLAFQYVRIGDLLAKKNDPKGAIARYYDALNVRELLIRKTPGNEHLVQAFVDINGKLAAALRVQENVGGALRQHQRALASIETFLAERPNNKALEKARRDIQDQIRSLDLGPG